jgi:hypothetical protein
VLVPPAVLSTLLLLLTLTTTAEAQDAPLGVRGPRAAQVWSAVPRGPLHQAFAPDSVRHRVRPTHWKEGALIGGLAAGVGLALVGDALCRGSDAAGDCGGALTAGFLVGGVMGGFVGMLIGGQVPKDEDD